MSKNDKRQWRQITRWIRIGALSFTALSPVINAIGSFLRERAQETQRELERQRNVRAIDPREKLVAVGATVRNALEELKHNPYSQDLLARGEEVAGELIERGSRLSQAVAERGNQFARDVAIRGTEFTEELAERGERASKELSRRSRQARRDLTGRRNPWILMVGFAVGLLATAIIASVLIRRRMQKQLIAEEEMHIELSNGRITENVITGDFNRGAWATSQESTAPSAATVAAMTNTVPPDAILVGVVGTHRYYPVETPLDQLGLTAEMPLDVVYFSSEEDAKAQGYSAAE